MYTAPQKERKALNMNPPPPPTTNARREIIPITVFFLPVLFDMGRAIHIIHCADRFSAETGQPHSCCLRSAGF